MIPVSFHPSKGLQRTKSFRQKGDLSAVFSRETRFQIADSFRICLMASDTFAVISALIAGFYVRFELFGRLLPPQSLFAPAKEVTVASYLPSIVLGAGLQLLFLLATGAYQSRTLLRFRRFFPLLIKATITWAIAFAGISLILEFGEFLSRVYVLIAFVLLLLFLSVSRFLVQRIASRMGVTAAFRQRILFVNWTERAARIAKATMNNPWNPYEIIGAAPSAGNVFTTQPPEEIATLGSYQEIRTLCERGLVDIVVLADARRSEQDILALARECEKTMVDFMVIPTGFEILLSGLELTTISRVPLLGVTSLPLNSPLNSAIKRVHDIFGALIGLTLSAPLIAIFCALVYAQSPGPVLYSQTRVGRKGRHFKIVKIRSMKLDAEIGSGARWASKDDDRRLKIGTFMRRWNIDELPQFWNVLMGSISLVGPRPERPELIHKFRDEIPYYNARHNILPGMTGWAQVNGFRGDTDLNERIRCDIYYIENWNPILDLQIQTS